MSPSVSLGGAVPLPVTSAPSTSSTCQAEYSSQNVHFPHLANAQDATVTSFVPSTSASTSAETKAGDGIAYHKPRTRAESYPEPAVRPEATHLNQDTNFAGGNIEAMEGTLHMDTSLSSHLDDIVMQEDPYVRRQPSQNPMPSTRTLRPCRNNSSSTNQAFAPKRTVIHDARTISGTHLVQTQIPENDAVTDTPHCDDTLKHADLPESFTELIRAMKTRINDSGKRQLTKNATITKEGGRIDDTTVMKVFPCPSCEKVKTSQSELK